MITLIEDVFNVLLNADVAITNKQILKFLVRSESKVGAVSSAILEVKGIKGCDVTTFKRGIVDYHIMTSTENYEALKPRSNQTLIIEAMTLYKSEGVNPTMREMHARCIRMGCRAEYREFTRAFYIVSSYNNCEMESIGKGANRKYRMKKSPVKPYSGYNKPQEQREIAEEASLCDRSAVNFLFAGNAAMAMEQNKLMIKLMA